MDSFNVYRSMLFAVAALPLGVFAQEAATTPIPGGVAPPSDWATSPPYEWQFEEDLVIPPVKEGKEIDGITYYEMVISEFQKQVYPDLLPTTFQGYDGISPGPTIKQKRGHNSVLRVVNNITDGIVTHLHGSYTRAPFDGWAEDIVQPGHFKDYYYPNGQTARTIWYHDHADDHTAEHNFFGQFGQYIIYDPEQEKALGLPSGKYDIPLNIVATQFEKNGTLWSPDRNHEILSVFGDFIMVNGVPWPKLEVEPRKYRFRLLDASVSRSFFLYLEESGDYGIKRHYKSQRPRGGSQPTTSAPNGLPEESKRIPFTVIASDSGYLDKPVETSELYLSMAERWEIVIDFSKFAGKKLTLKNVRGFTNDFDFKHTDKIMQFHVKKGSCKDDSKIPDTLTTLDYPKPQADEPVRKFVFAGAPRVGWTINNVSFSDVANRILAKPERGAVEKWILTNNQPVFNHPIHMHMVDFRVLSRKGNRTVQPYETHALKDTVWLAGGETVEVEAVFAPWEGVYMFHCHNLIHEDHAMMAAYNVSLLNDFGYDEKTHFVDPLDPTYAARPCNIGDMSTRTGAFADVEIKKVIDGFEDTQAYQDIDGVETALETYWTGGGRKEKRDSTIRRSAKFRA